MNTLIITGGTICDAFLLELYQKGKFDCVIAADHGAEAARRLQIPLDHLVGDFDSADHGVIEEYLNDTSLHVEQHVPEKDATDTELALIMALKLGSDHITLVGATGTRLDHVLSNIYNLLLPLRAEVPCVLADSHNQITLLKETTVFHRREAFGKYISFLPLTERVEGITLTGFKYGLQDYCMKKGENIGVSNEFAADEAIVSFREGILICIQSRD